MNKKRFGILTYQVRHNIVENNITFYSKKSFLTPLQPHQNSKVGNHHPSSSSSSHSSLDPGSHTQDVLYYCAPTQLKAYREYWIEIIVTTTPIVIFPPMEQGMRLGPTRFVGGPGGGNRVEDGHKISSLMEKVGVGEGECGKWRFVGAEA